MATEQGDARDILGNINITRCEQTVNALDAFLEETQTGEVPRPLSVYAGVRHIRKSIDKKFLEEINKVRANLQIAEHNATSMAVRDAVEKQRSAVDAPHREEAQRLEHKQDQLRNLCRTLEAALEAQNQRYQKAEAQFSNSGREIEQQIKARRDDLVQLQQYERALQESRQDIGIDAPEAATLRRAVLEMHDDEYKIVKRMNKLEKLQEALDDRDEIQALINTLEESLSAYRQELAETQARHQQEIDTWEGDIRDLKETIRQERVDLCEKWKAVLHEKQQVRKQGLRAVDELGRQSVHQELRDMTSLVFLSAANGLQRTGYTARGMASGAREAIRAAGQEIRKGAVAETPAATARRELYKKRDTNELSGPQ